MTRGTGGAAMNLDRRFELDLEIATEDAPPPPLGAPVDFRERLVLALRTTEPRILAVAEAGYRGIFTSQHDYIVERLAERLDPSLAWVLACATPQNQIETGLREAGLSQGIATCMAGRLADRLSIAQLLELRRVTGDPPPGGFTAAEFLRRAATVDPEIYGIVSSAALACAV